MAVSKDDWIKKISDLKSKEDLFDKSKDIIIEELASKVESTILTLAKQSDKTIGVLFSGGVDSTLICYVLQKNNIPFVAATVGFRDNKEQKLPDDIYASREIAEVYGFNRIEKIYSFEDIELIFGKTVSILGESLVNVVNVGVGSVEVAGIELLKSADPSIELVFGGLGSEEIFAGYKRHRDAEDKHNECWFGLVNMYERDLLRDFAFEDFFKIQFAVPFLDSNLIGFAMNIPVDFKITDNNSKIILRESAVLLGLDKKFSFRPKQAAQYGSRTDKALSKLAKKNGFVYKKDYLNFLVSKFCSK